MQALDLVGQEAMTFIQVLGGIAMQDMQAQGDAPAPAFLLQLRKQLPANAPAAEFRQQADVDQADLGGATRHVQAAGALPVNQHHIDLQARIQTPVVRHLRVELQPHQHGAGRAIDQQLVLPGAGEELEQKRLVAFLDWTQADVGGLH
jgi:hypothetical protein